MTDHDQLREAIKWAREQAACDSFTTSPPDARARADMLRLLASDVESRLLRTKMVEVWRVEYARLDGKPAANTVTCEVLAKDEADRLRVVGATCIRVTGPHQQEVPV